MPGRRRPGRIDSRSCATSRPVADAAARRLVRAIAAETLLPLRGGARERRLRPACRRAPPASPGAADLVRSGSTASSSASRLEEPRPTTSRACSTRVPGRVRRSTARSTSSRPRGRHRPQALPQIGRILTSGGSGTPGSARTAWRNVGARRGPADDHRGSHAVDEAMIEAIVSRCVRERTSDARAVREDDRQDRLVSAERAAARHDQGLG
jgi:hypothetical protein